MRKQSIYTRKRARVARIQARQQAEASLREMISADVRALQTSAGLHAWTGNDPRAMVNQSGRMCFIVAYAANQAGFDADHVDMRILRGMAGALADLAADPNRVEHHRTAIQTGLQAIGRLLPHCDDMVLLAGAALLEGKLATEDGLGTHDVAEALGVAV